MNVIFTADVEGHVGNNPVKHLIYGITKDGKKCGIDLLMNLLNAYKIRGLFFVDIAEAWDYGEENIARVLKHIKARGHDVGVHIHPDHMADRKRLFLSEYSRDEQFEIIKKCTNFYKKVLGDHPIAFRAGKYGANWDTLNIISELGYKADFSQFYGRRWCHIDPPCTCVRRTALKNGLIEIPVTVYRSLDLKVYSRIDKIDADQNFAEFCQVMNVFLEGNYCDTIVLFAHSFSAMDWRRTPNAPTFSEKKCKRLKKQIEYVINNQRCEMKNLDEIIKIDNCITGNIDQGILPTLEGINAWKYYGYRVLGVVKSRLDVLFRES